MGVKNNECVIATTWNQDVAKAIKKWCGDLLELQQSLFAFVPALMNDKETVFLAPCGSKKGLAVDEEATELRNIFINFLETFNYDDGSSPIDWVEVGYGEFGQKVLRGNCKNRYDDREYAG